MQKPTCEIIKIVIPDMRLIIYLHLSSIQLQSVQNTCGNFALFFDRRQISTQTGDKQTIDGNVPITLPNTHTVKVKYWNRSHFEHSGNHISSYFETR